ncbi:MAG: hypothetical protein SFZ03_07440 [Candidatus Melainabacteria bacterium]|nr:hypothetical protein [Candidatus Melainabacteria bacterium]
MLRFVLIVALFLSVPAIVFITTERDYDPRECPVVGNTSTQRYYRLGDPHYGEMLKASPAGAARRCFNEETEAQAQGFHRAQNPSGTTRQQ